MGRNHLWATIATALLIVAVCLGMFLLWNIYDGQAKLETERQVGSNTQLKLLAAYNALDEAQAALDEAQIEIEILRQEINMAHESLDNQLNMIDQMADEQAAAEASFTAQIDTLTRALERAEAEAISGSSSSAATAFVGIHIPLRFELPKDVRALEFNQTVYLSGKLGEITGLLRVFADINGMPLQAEVATLDELFHQLMDQMGVEAEQRPAAAEAQLLSGEALRFTMEFTYDDGTDGFSEVCLMKGPEGYYCLELEGLKTQKRAITRYMDAILPTLSFEN